MNAIFKMDRPGLARWSLCAVFVLGAHVGGAAALLRHAPLPLLPDLAKTTSRWERKRMFRCSSTWAWMDSLRKKSRTSQACQ